MQRTGEWGSFFPIQLSSYPYNDTVAFDFFPVTTAQAAERGWSWSHPEQAEKNQIAERLSTSAGSDQETLLDRVFVCAETTRRFKILRPELELYARLSVPPPLVHESVRHRQRIAKRNPCTLFLRSCHDCQRPVHTSYPADRPETIVCEKCYLERSE